jgi:hypothetical protein
LIRDPIERIKSHHRFLYPTYKLLGLEDINELVSIALEEGQSLSQMRVLAFDVLRELQEGSASHLHLELLLKAFTTFKNSKGDGDGRYHRAAIVISRSMYFPPIFLWDRAFGEEYTYIIESERFQVSNDRPDRTNYHFFYSGRSTNRSVSEEFREIFSFLGLNSYPVQLESIFAHKSLKVVPAHHELSEPSIEKLEEFLEPFNQLLRIYMRHRRPPRRLT